MIPLGSRAGYGHCLRRAKQELIARVRVLVADTSTVSRIGTVLSIQIIVVIRSIRECRVTILTECRLIRTLTSLFVLPLAACQI